MSTDAQSTQDKVTIDGVLGEPLNDSERAYADELLANGESPDSIAYLIARSRGFPIPSTSPDPFAMDFSTFAPRPQTVMLPQLVEDDSPGLGGFAPNQNSVVFGQVKDRQMIFLAQVRREFQTFPTWVQNAFKGEASLNGVRGGTADGVSLPSRMVQPFSDEEVSYLVIRTLLWKTGYRQDGRPASLFSADRIAGPNEATFLSLHIENGIDRAMLSRLRATEAIIPKLLLDVASRDAILVAPRIKTIIGFQPRRVVGYKTLSNHTFGDAVDIDARWNPLITGKVSKVIQDHSNIDFSQEIISPNKDIDTLVQELTAGSNAFTQWIQSNLPHFEDLEAQLDKAAKELATATEQYNEATTQADKDAARAAVVQATKEVAAATVGLAETDMADIQILQDALPKDSSSFQDLTQSGYLTLGVILVEALLNPNGGGFTWGGSWRGDRKDFMHFDFVIPKPDTPPIDRDGTVPAPSPPKR